MLSMIFSYKINKIIEAKLILDILSTKRKISDREDRQIATSPAKV
jgi:hypothetical protein